MASMNDNKHGIQDLLFIETISATTRAWVKLATTPLIGFSTRKED